MTNRVRGAGAESRWWGSAPGSRAPPERTHIIFAAVTTEGEDLYLADADGSHIVRLTQDGLFNAHPSFSPDGSRIVSSNHNETLLVD